MAERVPDARVFRFNAERKRLFVTDVMLTDSAFDNLKAAALCRKPGILDPASTSSDLMSRLVDFDRIRFTWALLPGYVPHNQVIAFYNDMIKVVDKSILVGRDEQHADDMLAPGVVNGACIELLKEDLQRQAVLKVNSLPSMRKEGSPPRSLAMTL